MIFKKEKTVIPFILILFAILSCSPVNDPSDWGEYSWFSYQIIGEGVVITGLSSAWWDSSDPEKTALTIPEEIRGLPVTGIRDDAFFLDEGFYSVVIPDSVQFIGKSAFQNCYDLVSVTMGNSVTTIGDYAFADCHSLTSINIGNSVSVIGNSSFSGCGFTSIIIPDSVATIGDSSISNCRNLESVHIGRSASGNLEGMFRYCENLVEVNVDAANPVFSSADGILFNENKSTLICYPAKKPGVSYTIPDSVTTLSDEAFYKNVNLESLTIGDNVNTFGDSVFMSSENLTDVTLGNSVTEVGSQAFRSCNNLASVTFGNNITTIGDTSFYSCDNLTAITLPDSVKTIGPSAFSKCEKLATVTFGSQLETIDAGAFLECESLTRIDLPASVSSVGGAFGSCSGLTEINVDGSNTVYCSVGGILYSKDQSVLCCYPAGRPDTTFTVPNTVSVIGDYAFRGSANLESVTVDNPVREIKSYAFLLCNKMTEIVLPDSLEIIGDRAFMMCSELETVTVNAVDPPELEGDYVFYLNSDNRKFYVKSGSVNNYKIAEGWSEFADYIVSQ